MRAVVYTGYGRPLELRDVPEPECPADGVVLDVRATGVCRSDWHAWKGHEQVPLPQIPGHELSGVVVDTGPEVRRWRPGARVTVPFVCGCGRCEFCAAGEAQVCPQQTQPGFTGPGSFAERVAIHAADLNLVALPDDVGFVAAASLGCRFATAFRALTAHGQLRDGEHLVVHGCGGVGLSAVQIGVALGARVVAVDVAEESLARARALGAEAGIRSAGMSVGDVAATVRELTGGGGHVSVDAFGAAETCEASVRCLRRRGRHVQIGLLFGPAATPPIPMDVVTAHELAIHGSHGMPARDYPRLLELVSGGALRPDALVENVLTLAEAPAALAAMDAPSGSAGMTVVEPGRGLSR